MPDVQAALTTLTRWIEVDTRPPEWLTADLAHTDLRGANLSKAILWHVRLRGADLTGANLSETDLRGTDLRETVLEAVHWSGARADDTTWWPPDFDPRPHGLVIEPSGPPTGRPGGGTGPARWI